MKVTLLVIFWILMVPMAWAQDDACLGPQPDYCAQPDGSWSRGFLKHISEVKPTPAPEPSVWDSKGLWVGLSVLACVFVLGFIIELIKGIVAFIDYRDHKKAKLIAYYMRNGT